VNAVRHGTKWLDGCSVGTDSTVTSPRKGPHGETLDQPSELSRCAALAGAHGRSVARSSCGVWTLGIGGYAILPVESKRDIVTSLQRLVARGRRSRFSRLGNALRRQHRDPRPPARSWWKKGAPRALGRSRGGFGTKIHLRSDRKGNPIVFTLTGGEKHDAPQLLGLVDIGAIRRVGRGRPRLRPACVAGDKGYDSAALRSALRRRGIEPLIPQRSNRKRILRFDKERYRERNVIERCIGRLKQWRRVATRYEKLASNYLAVVLIAASVHYVNLLL
jgi:transposase